MMECAISPADRRGTPVFVSLLAKAEPTLLFAS